MKIVHIEDHPPSQMLVRRMLKADGHEIVSAATGRAGLEAIERERPDLVLTDINLPDISGLEVVAYLRQSPELAAIPIIAITANGMPGDRESFLALGCNAYLTKPIIRHELLLTIQQVLHKTSAVSDHRETLIAS